MRRARLFNSIIFKTYYFYLLTQNLVVFIRLFLSLTVTKIINLVGGTNVNFSNIILDWKSLQKRMLILIVADNSRY